MWQIKKTNMLSITAAEQKQACKEQQTEATRTVSMTEMLYKY